MHGGMKIYRGAAAAARHYVEADRSRADDYYLAEGSGVAMHFNATPDGVERRADMDGATYERWVAGYDVDTGLAKGRLRKDEKGVRFVEVTVNGPKTWSLAAALHPEIAEAYDAAQMAAAEEIIGLARHATRPRESGRAVGRCRCRSSRSRQPSYATSPRGPATPIDTCTSRSTPECSRRAPGEGSIPSGSATAWRRSTGSGTRR